jgi:hypothetical protein
MAENAFSSSLGSATPRAAGVALIAVLPPQFLAKSTLRWLGDLEDKE